MDDDTFPDEDCLEQLIKADILLKGNYGFLSSYARWVDDTYCVMNKPDICEDWIKDTDLIDKGILGIKSASLGAFT